MFHGIHEGGCINHIYVAGAVSEHVTWGKKVKKKSLEDQIPEIRYELAPLFALWQNQRHNRWSSDRTVYAAP